MFKKLFKRRLLPPSLRPALSSGERVLAWALTPAQDAVVATNLGLWAAGERTPWSSISKAVWDGSGLLLTTSEVVASRDGYSVIADHAPRRIELADPDHLPHQVRLRVTSSVKDPAHHDLPEGGGLWIAARRVPGVDGLTWIVRYDTGTDADDPVVVAATEAIFAETHWRTVGGGE